MLSGCIVVKDVEALDRALNGEHRTPILFTENGRDFIRIWPSGHHQEPMRVDAGLLGWFRDLVLTVVDMVRSHQGQTANVA